MDFILLNVALQCDSCRCDALNWASLLEIPDYFFIE